MLCDKHVPKMLLETAQLLCSPFEPGEAPYKRTHYNHPASIWTRTSYDNYCWLLCYGDMLSNIYTFMFNKRHKSSDVIHWCNNWFQLKLDLPKIGLTDFAQCMPDKYRIQNDPIQAYRNYYKNEKSKFAKWEHGREKPCWW